MTVAREQAEAVLAAVRAKYATHIGEDSEYGPTLIENWHWLSEPTPWAIVWEGGPFEWAYRFSSGGFDDEVYSLAAAIFGDTAEGRSRATGMATEPPADDIPGVFIEPINHWALGLYLEA